MNVDLPLNLLPWRAEQRHRQKQRHYRHLLSIVLGIAMAATVLWVQRYGESVPIKRALSDIQHALRVQSKDAAHAQAIVSARLEDERAWHAMHHSMRQHTAPFEVLHEVLLHRPSRAKITRVAWESDTLAVEGAAQDIQRIETALKTLVTSYRCIERQSQGGRIKLLFKRYEAHQ